MGAEPPPLNAKPGPCATHTDPTNWREEPAPGRPGWIRSTCRVCGAVDIVLTFDKRCQRFTAVEDPNEWKPEQHRGKLQAALAMAWDQTRPADDEGGEF